MMFPVRGGAFNSVNKKIRKHEVIPAVSSERICIKSCGSGKFINNTVLYTYLKFVSSSDLQTRLSFHFHIQKYFDN